MACQSTLGKMRKRFKHVPLYDGGQALVDLKDYFLACSFKWYRQHGRYTSYARANGKMKNGIKGPPIYLHRVIMAAKKGTEVDHKNGNGLDCRRSNMKVTTRRGNAYNSKVPKNSTTGIKGVTWSKHAGKYMAKIKIQGHQTYLGYFTNPNKAKKVISAIRNKIIKKETICLS